MLVSVVIPSYNHSRYVLKAIDSVLAQSWPHIDLIVIDDGSTDGSPETIRALHDRRGGFRFIARENQGLIRTLNQGIVMARGEAFCLLASDDYLLENSIKQRVSLLTRASDTVAVFADAHQIDRNGAFVGTVMDDKRKRLFQLEDVVPEFLRGVNLPIHTMLVKTAVLRKIGGFDSRYQYCEDLDVQLLLSLQGPVQYLDSPVYAYRVHGSSISRSNRNVARADKVLCFRKYLEEVPALIPYRRLIRRRLRRHYLLLGRYLLSHSQASRFEQDLFRSGWRYAWPSPRLYWYLFLWQLKKYIACRQAAAESP